MPDGTRLSIAIPLIIHCVVARNGVRVAASGHLKADGRRVGARAAD
jgi:hypothetical protein